MADIASENETGSSSKGALLADVSVLVTRGTHQATPLSSQLLELGARIFEFPVIALEKPDSFVELEQAFTCIENYDWIVFASVNAVDFFFEHFDTMKKDRALLKHIRFATIGPATTDALERTGFHASFTPQSFVADALVDEFESTFVLSGTRFLWPRTNIGRQLIKERFTKAGALVDIATVYQTVMPKEAIARANELLELLETHSVNYVTLTSSQSVKNFAAIVEHALSERAAKTSTAKISNEKQNAFDVFGGIEFVSIGPETTKTIESQLGRSPLQARTFTIPGIVERIIESVTTIG